MKNDAVKIKSAAEWQGSDLYAGIDSYEKMDLQPGTKLYALVNLSSGELKPCEYFFDKQALDKVGFDATQLNQGLQISPRMKDENFAFYKSEVVQFEVKQPLQVETGKTAENVAYGPGGFTQYYIPAQKFLEHIDSGALKRAPFGESSQVLLLDNMSVSKVEMDTINLKHDQLLLRRNLFCHQKAKLDTMDIIQNSPNANDVLKATENLEKLNGHILQIKKDLNDSVKVIGRISSPLYDSLNKQLNGEIRFRESLSHGTNLDNTKLQSGSQQLTVGEYAKNHPNQSNDAMIQGELKAGYGQSNTLMLSNAKMQGKAQCVTIGVYENTNIKVVGGLSRVDDMDVNRINRTIKEEMMSAPLRSRDYSQVDTLAMQKADGSYVECKLSDHFTEDSIRKIQSAKNGLLTDSLQMNDGRLAKLFMIGERVQLFLSKTPLELEKQVEQMPLDDSSKKNLLSGGVVMGGQGFMQIDRELNAIVPASPAQPLMGQVQHVSRAIHKVLPKKQKLSY